MPGDGFFAPDCTRCVALCCVAPAFDKGDDFAIDKPARAPCPNLDAAFACSIHSDLIEKGFHGCVTFDCLGAGQRVVQQVFEGRNWRDDPQIAQDMFDCFGVMRQMHALSQLLSSARKLDLGSEQRVRLSVLEDILGADQNWSADEVLAFNLAEASHDVHEFLTSLQPLVGQTRP